MKNLLQKTHLRVFMLVALLCAGLNSAWGAETYSLTPTQENTGSNATTYITTLTGFTYNGISWKMNQWNPSTLQIRTNQSSAASEFRFYNSSPFPGKITKVVIKFQTLNVSDASKLMFIGGTTEVTATSGGTAGTWNSSNKTLTWTPTSTDNFTYFAFYQNGKAATGTNSLNNTNAIVVTYETGSSTLTASDLGLTGSTDLSFDLFNNSSVQAISYTTSSTGAVTVSGGSGYVTTSVNESAKTITITPVKVTPSPQTITVSQAADDQYAAGSAEFTVSIVNSDPNLPGAINNPYSVAQAIENTPANGNTEDVYVKGIVSRFYKDNIMSDGTNFRYYISDENANNQLLVFKGNGLDNVAFSDANDLQIDDIVVIKGKLTTYNNTKEINSGNYIVSLVRKQIPTLSFGQEAYSVVKNGALTITATSTNSNGTITYESSNTDVAEIDATSGVVTAKAAGTTTITATIAATETFKTANATVELTVTAPKHKVTFYQNGTKLSEAEVSEDAAIEFPADPADIEGKAFVGWTTTAIDGSTNNAPTTLVKTATMGTGDVTYYAVFAIKEGTAEEASITINANTEGVPTSYGTANTFTEYTLEGIKFQIQQMYKNGEKLQWRAAGNNSGTGTMYNSDPISSIQSIVLSYDASDTNKNFFVKVGNTANPTEGTVIEASQNRDETYIYNCSEAYCDYFVLTNGSGAGYLSSLTINYLKGNVSYSDYCTTVTAEQPVVEPGSPVEIAEGYYSIKNNGNNKYVRVAGRKTVVFDDNTNDAGTVIRVKANEDGQVEILRSQGIDVPSYAEKAMTYYVPKIVELAVDKLHAEGSGTLLGENGLDAIMTKFKEGFDYHLYTEQAEGGVRIYGKTPSMKPVVDFYAENKANVDEKLPMLEDFINSAIQKILQKTNGRGASILTPFSLHDVWVNMGKTLTEPVDANSTAQFYEQVLTSEENVWNFAYQTAMIYWGNVKKHPNYDDYKAKLGEYAKYIDKVENIQPNFKYYIVQKDNQIDFISQGNSELNAAFTSWTLTPRTDFTVTFNEENALNGKYYTTLYTDFAYTLPESVKAYKVTGIEESGCFGYAVIEEVGSQNIAGQTPVLLISETAEPQELTLSETGTTVTGTNLLKGPDYLINTYEIKAAQVESLFDMAKALLGEEGYNNYLKEYEHLMLRTAGTVNNKYFFGLSKDDCKNLDENVCLLGNSEEAGIGFANDWQTMNVNQAFLVSDIYTAIRLSKVGDINRDGSITIADLTALVDIILGKIKYPDAADMYDFGAADVNCDDEVNINDVTILVDLIMDQNLNN